jgi:SEC-C motif-containing protein
MRSRFSAFALGLGDYLVRTLAKTHADRALPSAALSSALSRAKDTQRFLGLRIVRAHAAVSDATEGEVLFVARVFERGADRSFAELSRFVREDGAWRYESGVVVPASKLPPPRALEVITRDAFASLAITEENARR